MSGIAKTNHDCLISLRSFKESSKNKNFKRTPSSKEHEKEEKLNISTSLQASI